MHKVHAIKATANGGIKAYCGRVGYATTMFRAGKWGYVSGTGQTIFQAVDPDNVADTTPRVTCEGCRRMMKQLRRAAA